MNAEHKTGMDGFVRSEPKLNYVQRIEIPLYGFIKME